MGSRSGDGRKYGSEWSRFSKIKQVIDDKTYTKQKCKECSEVVSSRVERLHVHLQKCNGRARCRSALASATAGGGGDGAAGVSSATANNSEPEVEYLENSPMEMEYDTSSSSSKEESRKWKSSHSGDNSRFAASATASSTSQSCIDAYAVKTSVKCAQKLDRLCAEFFYSCNLPFMIVESPQFITFVQALRPGYKPPSRFNLAGHLLDEVYEEEKNEQVASAQGKYVTFMEDGWTNQHGDPIIGNCVGTVGSKPYFLNSVDTGSERKTAEYCCEKAADAINYAQNEYKCVVTSCVSDSEAKMVKMRQLLVERFPDLITYGCGAHWLNLLEGEIIPASLNAQIVQVQKYFRQHHLPHGWLDEFPGAVKPQLPNDTRWNSYKACTSTFVKNHPAYCAIREEHIDEMKPEIARILDNVAILREAKNLERLLTVIGCSLNKIQNDNASISDATKIWIDFTDSEVLAGYKDKIKKQFQDAITPAHLVAYKTDPQYKGKGLTAEQEIEASQWLETINPNFVPHLILFDIQDPDLYPKAMLSKAVVKKIPARKWWKKMETACGENSEEKDKNKKLELSEFSQFCNFVVLHSMPASSASVERLFSTYGLVHTKVRNRLGNEKTEKLVFIYRKMKGKTVDDYEDC